MVALQALPRDVGHALCLIGIVERGYDRIGKGGGITRREGSPGDVIDNELSQPTRSSNDERGAECRTLKTDETEGFVETGQDEGICRGHERVEVRVGQPADEVHRVGDASLLRQRFQCLRVPTSSGHNSAQTGCAPAQFGEGIDKCVGPLLPLEAADENHERPVCGMRLACLGRLGRSGAPTPQIDAVRDDVDMVLWGLDIEELLDLTSHVVRTHDDAI